jgi:hypothetical protein
MTNIFLARQPILNHDQSVEGFELLYRGGDVEQALVDDQALAALIDHTGAGRLLDCVTAIEHGNFEHTSQIFSDSSEHYLESVAWSNDVAKLMIG